MFKHSLTFGKISNFIYEKITSSRLFFIIGDNGIEVLYYKNNIFIESYFAHKDKVNEDIEFENFISKYKKSDAKLILNLKEAALQHESLPIIGGLGKTNPVEKFCETHFHSSDLYTFKVYSIINGEADLWKAIIMWTPVTPLIEKCLFLTKENEITLAGVYFHSFAMQPIANKIAKNNLLDLSEYIYSATSISKNSGIHISINHGNNILFSTLCEYPVDKSSEYIQGLIEQNLSDSWLKFKSYIQQNQLKKLNILLLPTNLKSLLALQTYEVEKSIFADCSENKEQECDSQQFLKYFNQSEQPQALSSELKSYYRYHIINNVLFKVAYAALFLLSIYAANLKKNTFLVENNTSQIYKNYFKTTEDIRLKSQNFPNISNVSQLADLYNLQSHLKQTFPSPFEYMEDLINLSKDYSKIMKMSWEMDTQDNNAEFIINCHMIFEMIGDKDPITLLQNTTQQLKTKYPGITITTQRIIPEENTTGINAKSISIKITLSGDDK